MSEPMTILTKESGPWPTTPYVNEKPTHSWCFEYYKNKKQLLKAIKGKNSQSKDVVVKKYFVSPNVLYRN